MNEVLINIKGWNSIINKVYKDKDLISLEELIVDYENALEEIEELKEEIEDLKNPEEDGFDEAAADDYRLRLL